MAKLIVSFTLDTEKDKRIVRWLEGLPNRERSKSIREALHTHLGKGGVTLGDIYEAIQELKQSRLVAASDHVVQQSDVPPDVLEKLGKLGLE